MRVGVSLGTLIAAVGTLAVAAVTSSNPLAILIGSVFAAVLVAVVGWLVLRRYVTRQLSRLSHAAGPMAPGSRTALLRGLLIGALAGAAAALAAGQATRVWLAEADASPGGSVLLGLALWYALSAWDLQRWQDANGLDLCINTAGPRFALTKSQGMQQAVLVPRDLDSQRQPDRPGEGASFPQVHTQSTMRRYSADRG